MDGARHHGVFDGPRTAHAPGRGGHFLDHVHFEIIGRAEAGAVGIDEGVKGLERFMGKDHDVGEQTMSGRIFRRTAFAFGSFGAAGPGAVSTGGLALFFRSHIVWLIW
jgi:hypothetical protein